jgi:putative FmdB family regulatory protein
MPIYEYRCQSCENEIEVFVRSKNEPESCPTCEGQLARKISRAGVIFKGSGFYVNDSRGSSGGDKKSSSGATNGSGEAKSESKSASSESSSSSTKSETSSKAAD